MYNSLLFNYNSTRLLQCLFNDMVHTTSTIHQSGHLLSLILIFEPTTKKTWLFYNIKSYFNSIQYKFIKVKYSTYSSWIVSSKSLFISNVEGWISKTDLLTLDFILGSLAK